MSASIDERPDRHVLTLLDHQVTQLIVEVGAVRMLTWTLRDALELRVSVPFTLRQADGLERRIDPREPEQLAPLLTLLGRRAEAFEMAREGALSVGFSDGTVVDVLPESRHEAWRLQGAGGLEGLDYRCPAGGGVPWAG